MDTQSVVTMVGFGCLFALFWYLKRPDLRAETARKLVEQGAGLIDVRSRGEFRDGHIDRARNIPIGELVRRSAELGDHARPIIVYCASGTRSAAAKRVLKRAGFTRVYNLGAMTNW